MEIKLMSRIPKAMEFGEQGPHELLLILIPWVTSLMESDLRPPLRTSRLAFTTCLDALQLLLVSLLSNSQLHIGEPRLNAVS